MANSIGFTQDRIANLQCPASKQQEIYWDSKTPSLGVRVTQGNAKSFIFQTRLHGKTIRITIGSLDTWALGQAQSEARRLKVLTDQGIDPRVERANLVAKAHAERLKGIQALEVWGKYIEARSHQWGERHKKDHIDMVRTGGGKVTRGLRKNQSGTKQVGILFNLLSLSLNEINRTKVLAWLKDEAITRPARARQALSALKAFLTWAGDQPEYSALADTGACERLTRELPAKKAKDDCLQKEQLKVWFDGVKKVGNPIISAYLQILLLTGARRNELASMKWDDLDLQWHTAIIRDKVEGVRTIPITPYVEHLLNNLPRVFKGKDGKQIKSQYVFASPTAKSGRLTEPRKAHEQVIETAGIPSLSIHGLRRSFGTLAEWTECPAGISAQIMGHKPSAIAEKHYRKRPIDLLRQWHTKIEKFVLEEAGIEQPQPNSKRLTVVVNKS
jgi:integrase